MTASISELLLDWYDRHARVLPWRNPPGAPPPDDGSWPYRVWLSEIMLQQTTVAAVTPRFVLFLARWPSVEALAAAPEGEVMAAWAGLGYYSRARNLLACARLVAGQGGFPRDEAGLRKLPGVGAYTAAAIAAFAFGQRAVVVDANVVRVVARLFAIAEPMPGARKAIRTAADCITPAVRAGDFAQAMMDLGAGICTARAPRCGECPLAGECAGLATGDPAGFPVRPAKKPRPQRRGKAWWITSGDKVWLVRRPAAGMLGGMRALPDDGWTAQADGNDTPPQGGEWRKCGAVRHDFTHASLTLAVDRLAGPVADGLLAALPEGEWWPIEQLDEAGLPTLFVKAARLALANGS